MSTNRFIPVLVLVSALPMVPARAVRAADPEPVSLSGRWRFNAEKSDNARQKMQEGGAGRHWGGGGAGAGGGGGFGGRRGGGGMGARRGGGPGGGGPGGGAREDMHSLFEAPPSLVVTETTNEIAVMEEDGRLRALHPDKQEYKDSDGRKVQTRWDGGHLIVESKSERGPKLTETWSVSGAPAELLITLRLDRGRGEPITLRRVYEPVPSE